MTVGTIHALTTEQIHLAALDCSRTTEGRHWTRLSAIIGRLADEHLFIDLGYQSLRAYVTIVMGMSPDEMFELLRLWRLIQAASGEVPPDEWASIPKTYAVEIRKLLNIGASPRQWVDRAKAVKSFAEFQAEIARYLDREPWVTISVRMPQSLAETFDACMVVALAEATGDPSPDAEMIHDKGTRFRCLEVVLRNFHQTYVHENSA